MLHKVNITLSVLACLFLMAACASYTTVMENIRNVPWFILKHTEVYVMKEKQFIGLRGIVKVFYDAFENEKLNDTKETLWIEMFDQNQCATTPHGLMSADQAHSCKMSTNCNSAGKVVVAFVIIAWMCAAVSAVGSYLRMGGDGYMKKLVSVICSVAAVISCLIGFTGFGSCMQWFTLESNRKTLDFRYFFPGAGGILSILAFIMFLAVVVINFIIPTGSPMKAGEEDAKDSGLAAQDDVQVSDKGAPPAPPAEF